MLIVLQIETIESVVAEDDLTVVFNLKTVTGPFEIYMAFPGSSIVPKDLVESGMTLTQSQWVVDHLSSYLTLHGTQLNL